MFENIGSTDLPNFNNDNAAMPRDLKLLNRAKILAAVKQADKVTINEIAEATGISRQTVIKSMESFLNLGIVVSIGKGSSTNVGGKKPEVFKFNEKYKYNICVRFENMTIIVALMDLKSEIIIQKTAKHNENQSLDVILSDFYILYKKILKSAGITEKDIYGVGFCMGGICDINTGIMRYNSLYPSWGQDIPIVDMIKKYIGQDIVVLVANDAKMTGMSELYYDSELESKKFVALYTLDGISAGLINKGTLELGSHTLIGEIGHITVDIFDNEICQCGNTGCFEKLVSEQKIYRIMRENSEKYNNSALSKYGSGIKLQNYFDCADEGDELAKEIVKYLAKNFAVVLKSICIISDPDTIIIQGNYSTAGEVFKRELEANLRNFKYFPKDTCDLIRYSNGEIYKKALMGLSMCLNNSLYKSII